MSDIIDHRRTKEGHTLTEYRVWGVQLKNNARQERVSVIAADPLRAVKTALDWCNAEEGPVPFSVNEIAVVNYEGTIIR